MLKLVYGCLAFSLVACVFLFISAAQEGESFRGVTRSMGDAVANGATVLDADRDGAVTQTGNGRVAGYKRSGGGQLWSTKFKRFEESPSNPYGAGADDAAAWCSKACPGAIVEFLGDYSAFAGASQSLAEGLSYLRPKPEDMLALVGKDSAFIRMTGEGDARPRLHVVAPNKQDAPLGAVNPSEVQPDRPVERAVVGSVKGKIGALGQLVRSGGTWRVEGRSIREAELKSVCVSDDENWIGSVSTRVRRFAFGEVPGAAIGPAVSGGTCTVDGAGITAVFTPKSEPTSIVAARFAPGGRMLWIHNFGAQRLLSGAGSPYVVAQSAEGTVTAVDVVSGRDAYRAKVAGNPFVGRDGSIVTASRKGEPKWLLVGGSQ